VKQVGLVAALAAAAAVVVAVSVPKQAAAHRSGCHRSHTCPSDHHTYPWHGLWCTSYASERLPSDTKAVTYGGIFYWCHGSGTASSSTSGTSGSGTSSGGDRGES